MSIVHQIISSLEQGILFEKIAPFVFKRMTDPDFMQPSLEEMQKKASFNCSDQISEKPIEQLELPFDRHLFKSPYSSAKVEAQQKNHRRTHNINSPVLETPEENHQEIKTINFNPFRKA
jgi:hypothetical protein